MPNVLKIKYGYPLSKHLKYTEKCLKSTYDKIHHSEKCKKYHETLKDE